MRPRGWIVVVQGADSSVTPAPAVRRAVTFTARALSRAQQQQ